MFAALLLIATASPAATVTLYAGGPGPATTDVLATQAKLRTPFGLAFDQGENGYVVELEGQRVLRVDAPGRLTTFAGTGSKGAAGDDGPAANAQFNGLHTLCAGPDSTLYLADTWNWRTRTIHPRDGIIRTLAGTGSKGFSGDGGPAIKAACSGVYSVALNHDGTMLVFADQENRRVRQVDLRTQVISLVAGNGSKGVPKDGDIATTAPLVDPRAACFGLDGTVYILERGGHALRAVSPDGHIRTVAGTGQAGFDGDGGPAVQAKLRGPKHLATDRDGTILIADTDNHCIRRYDPKTGTIHRVAGTGRKGDAGLGGPPEAVELNQPHGVTVRADGHLYICDSYNHRVLHLVP